MDKPVTTKKKKFEPWKDFNASLSTLDPELPIKAPPCPGCHFWNPRREFVQGLLQMSGVKLCHAQEMHHDFSCFQNKKEPFDAKR